MEYRKSDGEKYYILKSQYTTLRSLPRHHLCVCLCVSFAGRINPPLNCVSAHFSDHYLIAVDNFAGCRVNTHSRC